MGLPVITGITPTAPKVLIHGLSGVGKSTLAAKLKNPYFLDFEGGLNYIGCARTPIIKNDVTFGLLISALLNEAASGKRTYDTVVIDSIDWCVRRFEEVASGIVEYDNKGNQVHKDLKSTLNKANGGYGNGAAHFQTLIKTELIPRLSMLNEAGYGICLIAHAKRKSIMDADGIDTDRIAPKIHDKVVDPFIEWADDVFYLKNEDGERILVLEGDDNILAKNRQGLKGSVKLSEVDINELLTGGKKGK